MDGRRVPNIESMEGAGDYFVGYAADAPGPIKCLWFLTPNGFTGRIAGKGFGGTRRDGSPEPEWTITEDAKGIVTVHPSIDYPGHWHGHLTAGVWSDA